MVRTQVNMRIARKKSSVARYAAIGVWAVGILVCIAVGLAACGRDLGVGIVFDKDRSAVRECLKENTPSGEWEEIQWWAPVEHDGLRFVRLKYRTQNPFGGMSVLDEVFRVTDAGDAENWESLNRHLFPD